jgi:hypothetical protein
MTYLDAIRVAGFQDIQIIGETSFPLDFIKSDPILKDMAKKHGYGDRSLGRKKRWKYQ